jgi:hypothetical protein
MSKDFLTSAGCVVKVKGKGSSGAYKIQGWPTGQVGTGLITIDDILPEETDIATPVVAVDDHRALYKFGRNFGSITVRGTIYLGANTKPSSAVQSVSKAFESLRLSSESKPVNVSITSGYKCKAYFTQFAFGQADPDKNKIAYAMLGTITPK